MGGRRSAAPQAAALSKAGGPRGARGSAVARGALPTCRAAARAPAARATPPAPSPMQAQSLSGSSPGGTLDRAWHRHGQSDVSTTVRGTEKREDSSGKCCGRREWWSRVEGSTDPVTACSPSLRARNGFRRGTRHAPQHSDPSQEPLHRTGTWGPARARRPPRHVNANSQGKRGVDTGLITRGLSPPQTATSASSSPSRARPQPLGVQTRNQSTLAGRTRPRVYWGRLTRWSASLGGPGQVPPGPRTARRPTRRHPHTPASSASECFFWSLSVGQPLLCVWLSFLWGHRRATGASGPGLPDVCVPERVYSV